MIDDLHSEFIVFSEFMADMISLSYAISALLVVRIILNGLLKYKKDINGLVTIVLNLLLFIVVCYFTFKNLNYIINNSGYKMYIIWLLMAVLIVFNVKEIYSFIKSKSTKQKQEL